MMRDNTIIPHKTEYQFHTAAKQLYNLALFSVGDKTLAEQTAAGAFADAFKRLRDTSDIGQFRQLSCTLLYRYCKQVHRRHEYSGSCIAGEPAASVQCANDATHLSGMLTCLSFDERFIVLLFCLHKYSLRQIAIIMRLPCFVIEKRLAAAIGKTRQ